MLASSLQSASSATAAEPRPANVTAKNTATDEVVTPSLPLSIQVGVRGEVRLKRRPMTAPIARNASQSLAGYSR